MNNPLITVEHTVSMGHRLPSYNGLCSSPHGHNIRVVVTLQTDGTFVDFKDMDTCLKSVLSRFDHAMVLQDTDPLLAVLKDMGFRTVTFRTEPTTEALAQHVLKQMTIEVEARTDKAWPVRVVVHETSKYSAVAEL